MTHYFGGDPEGIFGATPFEVLHQLLLGLLKYIFDSLYIFRTIPKDWESFFKKRSCPEVPNTYSEANEMGLPPVDLTDPDQEPSSRKRARKTNVTITSTDIQTIFKSTFTGKSYDHLHVLVQEMCLQNFNLKKMLDTLIATWRDKVIVIYQNYRIDQD